MSRISTTFGLRIAVFLCCIYGICALQAEAQRPRVIKAIPDNGEENVDPNLKIIRVEFDQDMNQNGFSWVGGGPHYPEVRSSPRWVEARVCILPVNLKPNYQYHLSVNSNRFTNFRGQNGEPAIPYPISFKTGEGSSEPVQLGSDLNRQSIGELRDAIDNRYSYRDLRGLNWEQIFKKYTPALMDAKTPLDFAKIIAELLEPTQDLHITIRADGQSLGVTSRRATANYNYNLLAKDVPAFVKRSEYVTTGMFEDGIGYIMIASWSRDDINGHEPAFEALEIFEDAPGLVIDVRPNAGGDEPIARQFAGCFIEKPKVYAGSKYRDPNSADGFTQIYERILEPKLGRPKYRGKVAVLMGNVNMSSCEAFLLMMRQIPQCKLFGARSYGSSGNPKPVGLSNGVTVFLPSWVALRADGTPFELEGIAPDVEIQTAEDDFKSADPVLEAALAWLRDGN